MTPIASIFDDAATGIGLLAGAIAIGGFLGHARPALAGKTDSEVRAATVVGGLVAFFVVASFSAVVLMMR